MLLYYTLLLADSTPASGEPSVEEDDFCGAIAGHMIAGVAIAHDCETVTGGDPDIPAGGGGGGKRFWWFFRRRR